MNELNQTQAHILAIDYNLMPMAAGKCEPDRHQRAASRFMILAHWFDATNILVKYKQSELVIPDYP